MLHTDMLTAIRADLADKLAARPCPDFPPSDMPGDRWILLSALQKAVRRGETNIALSAAFTLLASDRAALFRRLPVIVLEDVGVGALNCTTGVIAASTNAAWRKSVGGDAHVLHALVSWVCRVPKCRAADNAILAGKDHPVFEGERERIGGMGTGQLVDVVADSSQPTTTRVMAAWRLAGTDRYPSTCWSAQRGDLDALFTAFDRAGVPMRLLAACRAAVGLMRYPLPISLPVVWSAVQGRPSEVQDCSVSPLTLANGVPTYALGKHTRLGKQALRMLTEQCDGLRRHLEQQSGCTSWTGAVGAAHFHVESAELGKQLLWGEACALERLGAAGDLNTFGIPVEAAPGFLNCFRTHLSNLDIFRVRLLKGIGQQ